MEGRGVVCDWIIKYILYQHSPEMNMKGKNCGPGVQLHCGEPVGDVAEGQPDLQEDWVHHAGAQRKPEPHTLCLNKHHIIIWAWTEQLNFQLKIDGKTYLASSNQKKAAKQANIILKIEDIGNYHEMTWLQATAAEAWNAIRATLLWVEFQPCRRR